MQNNISLTTLINYKAMEALKKITPLSVSLMANERASRVWKLRNSIPMYLESREVFDQNMELLDEDMERTANL